MRVEGWRKYILILLCFFCQSSLWAQSFTSTVSSNIPTNFGYLGNSINVTGLGNLDGSTIGVISVELTMTAGTVANGNTIYNEVEIYLEAPDRHATYIMDNDLSITNQTFVFTNDPSAANFKYVQFNATTPINNPYSPAVSFNALNQGQSANGTWRLYAKKSVAQAPATILSWKITFGSTQLTMGAPNQTCSTALPLPNTTLTGTSVSGTNKLHGIVVTDSRGSEVGSSGLTETSIWYSFSPKCKNDTIQITGRDSYIQSGILGGSCGSRGTLRSYKDLFNMTYNYLITTYVPGNTYFLAMDGSQADVYQYQIKWLKGSIGCITTNTLTTSSVANPTYCAGDSLYVPFIFTGIFAANNRFTAQLSDANGSFSSPLAIGFLEGGAGTLVRSKLPANLAKGSGYRVRVVSSDPVITGTVSANAFEVKNVPGTPTVLNGKTSVCPNEVNLPYSVNLVSDATRYRWKATSGVQLSSSAPDSASVSVPSWPSATILSVQAVNACGSSAALQKNILLLRGQAPTLSISSSQSTICEGDTVIFSSQVSNIGNNPIYQWKINGQIRSNNAPSFVYSFLKDRDTVSLLVKSEGTCLLVDSAASNKWVMTVKEALYPDVTINGNTSFCSGKEVSFFASTLNKGTKPLFKWYVNSLLLDTKTDSLFTSSLLKDKDTLWVTLESNAQCARPPLVVSPKMILQAKPSVTASLLLTGSTTSCQGEEIGFIATPQGGDRTPFFTWYVNEVVQQGTSSNFTSRFLRTGDKIRVTMNNGEECASPALVESNTWVVAIKDTVTPSLSIQSDTLFCKGQSLSFSTSSANGGSTPRFTWELEGRPLPDTGTTLSLKDLLPGYYTLTVSLTSSETCPRPYRISKEVSFRVQDSLSITTEIEGDTVVCKGSKARFSLKMQATVPGLQYEWRKNNMVVSDSNTFITLSLLQNDAISLALKTKERCVASPSFFSNTLTIDVLEAPGTAITLSPSKPFVCEGEEVSYKAFIQTTGTNPRFTWYHNTVQMPFTADSVRFTPTPTSFLELNYQDVYSCGEYETRIRAVSPSILQAPVLKTLSGPSDYCAQDSSLLFTTDLLPTTTYSWSFPSYASAITDGNKIRLDLKGILQTDSLKVSASNACGGGNTLSLFLNPKNCSSLFIPNTLLGSSNDGNELWQIKGLETNDDVKVMVFNRWGNRVFHSKGYRTPWDGTFGGKLLPTGTYYYLIEGANVKPMAGTLTILH